MISREDEDILIRVENEYLLNDQHYTQALFFDAHSIHIAYHQQLLKNCTDFATKKRILDHIEDHMTVWASVKEVFNQD